MRLPLAAAALTAVAATALPAQAAIAPTCAVALVADAVGTRARCSTNNLSQFGNLYGSRDFNVVVASGTVDAFLTCNGLTSTRRLTGPTNATVRRYVRMTDSCTSVLTAVTSNPKAAGVTTFAPRFFEGS